MIGLAETQRAFQAQILTEDAPLPAAWDSPRMLSGLDVYRNAYRARLISALRTSYERVWTWIGDEAFDAAAAHHLILNPPKSWTLDDAGLGFDATLAELFPDDPEVSELAWLEWTMQTAFTAPDSEALNAASFAARTTDFSEDDWAALRLSLVPSLVVHTIHTRCADIWRAIAAQGEAPDPVLLDTSATLIVWRDGLQPRFRVLVEAEAQALSALREGRTLGDICESLIPFHGEEAAAAQAGAMLGRWIGDGMIAGLG